MNMKRILTLLLALSLVATLASCKKDKGNNQTPTCEGHVDANDDYLCDKCGENYDDGDEQPDAVLPTEVDVKFNVKLDNGEALSGVKFTITRGGVSVDLTSGADGIVSHKLAEGSYAISYDYDTLPEYCTPDVFGFKVTADTTAVDLVICDNTPDGTEAKPFPIQDNDTEISLEPGQSIYYVYRGTTVKTLTINEDGISVNYNGQTYVAESGVVSVQFVPEIGKATVFSVSNTSNNAITTTMNIVAPLGSNENPIQLVDTYAIVSVSEESIIYYKWTADKDGVLVLRSLSEYNNISLTKVLENDVLVISQTLGDAAAYLAINAGDEITIGVSAIGTADPIEIDFTINSYAGTDANPVPVLVDELAISLPIGASIVFSAEAGKTLRINDESSMSVIHDTITYTNEGGVEIVVPLLNANFVVNNYSDHINGVVITFN